MIEPPLADRMLAEDPALRTEFEKRIATDKVFAQDGNARLAWFYERTPYYDQRYLLYPVGRELPRPSGASPRRRSAAILVPERAPVERMAGGEEQRADHGQHGLERFRGCQHAEREKHDARCYDRRWPQPTVAAMAEAERDQARRSGKGKRREMKFLGHTHERRERGHQHQ